MPEKIDYSVQLTWKTGNTMWVEEGVAERTALTAFKVGQQNPAVKSVRLFKNLHQSAVEAEWKL